MNKRYVYIYYALCFINAGIVALNGFLFKDWQFWFVPIAEISCFFLGYYSHTIKADG